MRVTTRRKIRQAAALLLMLLLLPLSFPAEAAQPEKTAAHSLLENLPFSVDGGEALTVKTLHYSYGNNRYVSLRDVAYALSGTVKSFSLAFQDGSVYITSGAPYTPAGGEGQGFPAQTQAGGPYVFTTAGILANPIFYNDRVLRYPNFLAVNPSGVTDCYLSVTDLALIMDLDLQVSADGMLLDTAGHFSIDLDALEREGFYCEVHSALVGDADTGEIYAAWEPDLSVPIASTTKLMTVLCLLDAAAAGEMTLEDTVTIPAEAAALSRSADGVIPMTAGQSASVPDLLRGMLLPSSNECALALAVHLDGSEAAFVERMNRKAREIGLSDSAVFFNCHGLPMFTDNLAATKVQNRMTARDMFLLAGGDEQHLAENRASRDAERRRGQLQSAFVQHSRRRGPQDRDHEHVRALPRRGDGGRGPGRADAHAARDGVRRGGLPGARDLLGGAAVLRPAAAARRSARCGDADARSACGRARAVRHPRQRGGSDAACSRKAARERMTFKRNL